jgi:membrane protein
VSQTEEMTPERAEKEVPGGKADKPTEIPKRGWLQIAKRGWAEAKADQVPLLGAGVAFYAFLALFPSLIAIVLIYGLVVDPATIANQVGQLTAGLPQDATKLITDQLTLASSKQTGAGIGLAVSILLALWSASGGMSNLMTAISTAYDEEQKRSFIKKRLLALGLTVGAIVFMVIMLALVAVFPALADLIDNGIVRVLLTIARWVLIAIVVATALAVLYRVAPDRDAPKMRWVSTGAVVATVLWLLASAGFSLYVANFGSYAKTYGAIAGIVVMLMWLWITAYAILLGAEINAESEQQTVRDTTKGAEAPLGERDAIKADSLPGSENAGADPKEQPKSEKSSR